MLGWSRCVCIHRDWIEIKTLTNGDDAAAEGEAFVQISSGARGGNADTIIYLLQEAEADFSRALADAKATESEAQSAYDKQMQDYKVGD